MGTAFSFTLSLLCLAAGGLMLTGSLRGLSAEQLTLKRLRSHVLPAIEAPRLRARGRALMVRLGSRVAGDAPMGALQLLLAQAGLFNPAMPFLFTAARLLMALTAALAALLPAWIRRGAIEPKAAALAFFFGFLVYRGFTIVLKLRVEARAREIRRELPYVLDLLLMVLDSGVSIDQALSHVAGQIGAVAPVCALLLTRYVAETEDGTPYDKALDRLAGRMAVAEGRDFAGLLKQNLFQGGELGQPLRRLATDIGEARLAFAREQLGKKSVLLTLAMLFFFMPVLMLALAGPAVADLVGTLGHVAHDLENQRVKQ